MDSDSKELLELTRENNKILRKMRRAQKIASYVRAFYWLVIIGVTVGSFYFLQPYVSQLQKFMQDSGMSINQLKNLSNMPR